MDVEGTKTSNEWSVYWRLPVNLYGQVDTDPIDGSEQEEADVNKCTWGEQMLMASLGCSHGRVSH